MKIRNWTRTLFAIGLIGLLQVAFVARSSYAQSWLTDEQLYQQAQAAHNRGDLVAEILYLAEYAEREPQRMQDDFAFAVSIHVHLWELTIALGWNGSLLQGRTVSGVSSSTNLKIQNMWRKGCPAETGEKADFVGTFCLGGGSKNKTAKPLWDETGNPVPNDNGSQFLIPLQAAACRSLRVLVQPIRAPLPAVAAEPVPGTAIVELEHCQPI
jgi:hypothetical protein